MQPKENSWTSKVEILNKLYNRWRHFQSNSFLIKWYTLIYFRSSEMDINGQDCSTILVKTLCIGGVDGSPTQPQRPSHPCQCLPKALWINMHRYTCIGIYVQRELNSEADKGKMTQGVIMVSRTVAGECVGVCFHGDHIHRHFVFLVIVRVAKPRNHHAVIQNPVEVADMHLV